MVLDGPIIAPMSIMLPLGSQIGGLTQALSLVSAPMSIMLLSGSQIGGRIRALSLVPDPRAFCTLVHTTLVGSASAMRENAQLEKSMRNLKDA